VPDTRGAVVTPIAGSKLGSWLAPFRSIIADVSNFGWFSPGIPIPPQAPAGTEPRRFDYPTGINISFVPRAEEAITMDQLRNLADLWDLLRAVIETRKDQIVAVPWKIQVEQKPGEKNAEYKARSADNPDVPKATKLFEMPDGDHLWQSWIRALLEDMFVLDAVTLYPFKQNGQMFVDLIDGATIKRLLDAEGRTPPPPNAAYQQIIKGVPGHTFTRDQLLYRPRNPRAWKIYGLSQVEQCVITVNLAIRRQMWKLNYYTVGNLPEAIAQVPDTWAPDKIKQFQEWWDSMLSGQIDQRRRLFFVPSFGGKDAISFPKQDVIKDEMDEWLARVVCYFFSVSPQPFIREGMSRYGVQQQAQMAKAEGLLPTLAWLARVMTDVLHRLGFPALEFVFQEEMESDFLKRSQIQEIRARNGISRIDEIREENGDEPLGVGAGIITGTGFVPFAGEPGAPEPPEMGGGGGFGGDYFGAPGNGNGGGPGGPSGPGGGAGPGVGIGVAQRSGALGPAGSSESPVGKRGGGRFAFATATQQARQAEMKQLIETYLARSRQDIGRRVVASYAAIAQPSRKRQPPPEPPENGGRVRGGQPRGDGGGPLEKAPTTGVKQALGVAADGLEAEMRVTAPVITPIGGLGVAAKPADSDLTQALKALTEMSTLFRERQESVGAAVHTDLARQYEERFENLKAGLVRVEAALKALPTEQPEVHVELPPAAPVTVNVAPPPAPPAPEIHTHVQIPEKVVEVAPGAVVINQPVQPQPPPPVIKIEAPAPSPAPVVQAPVNVQIVNKQKRPRSKTKVVLSPELKVQKTRRKVNRDLLGNVVSIDTLPIDEPPKEG
jgi:hypothetical protein